MATYKAEFLSHHYKWRVRPMPAYSMGLIYWWSRLASNMPGLVNFVTHLPGLSTVIKKIGGISDQREIPKYANQTFKDWFLKHPVKNRGRQPVILWADTFNNYFHPQTAIAAVHVLEAAGFEVRVPHSSLCCGRPLYDFGFLDQAKRQLDQILYVLGPAIRKGIPVIGLEPSCTAVFRDELINLMPNNLDAQRLSQQTYFLTEFLEKHAKDFEIPKLNREAVVHGHCHHKSVMGMASEEAILKKLGLSYDLLDSGCCGMAGSFGFEAEKYDVSIACGERVLLPAVRIADEEKFVITNGFSCREQIWQQTGREAWHISEVLYEALELSEEKPKVASQSEPNQMHIGLQASAATGHPEAIRV